MKLFIEGGIGAGKTTIGHLLEEKMNGYHFDITCKSYPENVEAWVESGLLKKMYEDPNRWMLTFQHMALMSKYLQHLKMNNDHFNIVERSGISDRYAFMHNAILEGQLQECEVFTYDLYYKTLTNDMNIIPDNSLFVFIDISPEICYQRMKKRSRDGEANVSLEYLVKIDKHHRENVLPRIDKDKLLIVNNDKLDDTVMKILNWLEEKKSL